MTLRIFQVAAVAALPSTSAFTLPQSGLDVKARTLAVREAPNEETAPSSHSAIAIVEAVINYFAQTVHAKSIAEERTIAGEWYNHIL